MYALREEESLTPKAHNGTHDGAQLENTCSRIPFWHVHEEEHALLVSPLGRTSLLLERGFTAREEDSDSQNGTHDGAQQVNTRRLALLKNGFVPK